MLMLNTIVMGGAASRAITVQNRAPLSGDEMMTQNDITRKHGRSVTMFTFMYIATSLFCYIKVFHHIIMYFNQRETMDRLSQVRDDPSIILLLCQVSTCDTKL